MGATTTEYPKSLLHGIAPTTDTLKLILVSGLVFDPTHEFLSDVQLKELAAGGGYATGGATLTSVVATYDAGTQSYVFTCADPTWNPATFSTDGAVLYKSTGSAATSPIMSYTAFGAVLAPNAQPFSVHCPATGFLKRQVVAGGA